MKTALEETLFSFSHEAPKPPERRRDPRHLTILKVGTLVLDGHRDLCLIRNISAGGLMAHAYADLHPGQHVEVEIQAGQAIPGKVSWSDDHNIGVAFDAPIDVEEILAGHGDGRPGWRARRPRVEVDRLATLRIGAFTYGANSRDISQGGVKLEIDHPIAPGTPVVLTLDGFRPVHGVVRWCHQGECGVEFNQVVPFEELVQWLRDSARHQAGSAGAVERVKGIEPSS